MPQRVRGHVRAAVRCGGKRRLSLPIESVHKLGDATHCCNSTTCSVELEELLRWHYKCYVRRVVGEFDFFPAGRRLHGGGVQSF